MVSRGIPGLARILVTEDPPEMLRLAERSLGERYRCEFATTAQQAREKFAVGTFDLALCDLEMLGESGLDWAEEITDDHPDRCYRPAFTVEQAIEVIKDGSGTQFDPRIVELLLEHLGEALSLRS